MKVIKKMFATFIFLTVILLVIDIFKFPPFLADFILDIQTIIFFILAPIFILITIIIMTTVLILSK